MIRYAILPASMLAMVLAGCTKTDDSGDTDTDNGVGCTNSIEVYPDVDATNVYYRTTIEAHLTTAEADATLDVEGVPGNFEWRDANTIVFTPTNPLAPNTAYTATLHFSCGDTSWSFNTGDVGTPVTADLVGKTFNLDLASGRFVHPAGVGDLLQTYLTTDVLVGVQSIDGTQISMIGAIGDDAASTPTQDMCAESIPFPVADFSADPYFQVGPETTTLTVQGVSVTIDDLMITGSFAPDGTYITGASLAGSIDTRPLVPLLAEGGEDDAVCQLAGAIGVSCEACSDGTGEFCLSIFVDNIQALEVADTTLTPITVDDIDCAGACADASICAPDTGN